MARVSRVAQAMRNAYRRDDGSFERMQAAAQKTRAERLAREQTEREATAQRREMQELARKRATNEHLAPIDPEEVLEDELPVTSIETVPVSTPPSRPNALDEDSLYDSVQHLAQGPVLSVPRKLPARRHSLPSELQAQIDANEVYVDPHTGQVEPLSPPPGADD